MGVYPIEMGLFIAINDIAIACYFLHLPSYKKLCIFTIPYFNICVFNRAPIPFICFTLKQKTRKWRAFFTTWNVIVNTR